MQNFNNKLRKHLYKSKRVAIIAAFCVFILISVQYNQTVPVIQYACGDTDQDGLPDDLENMSYYKYFEDNSTRVFNGDQGSQQGNGWTHYDFQMNILRPKYRFTVNVTARNNTGYLYILVGEEGNIEMNHSVTIDQTGEIFTFLIPTSSNLTMQVTRVRLNSNLNFSIDKFLMESNTDWNDSDTDGDGLSDGTEDSNFNQHTDSWETSPLMWDADGDGLSDGAEIDNNTDPLSQDSDDDGLSDYYEVINGYNPLSNDTDSDDLTDYDEINTYSTNATNNDTDGDGLLDGLEVLTYLTDPLDTDSDDDSLTDYAEIYTYSTDPNDSDTDGDGYSDNIEVLQYNTNPLNATEDQDGDGLIDPLEAAIGTNRTLTDTDGDNLTDYFEYETGWTIIVDGVPDSVNSDPTDRWTSGEGLYDDYQEYIHKTDPYDQDTDGDGLNDNSELVIFRTNADDIDQDGELDYDVANVWISTNRPRQTINGVSQDKFLLHNFDYTSTTTVSWSGAFYDTYSFVSVTKEGYNVYADKTQTTYPIDAYVFYYNPNIEESDDDVYYNVWKFTSSAFQQTLNESEKQTGDQSSRFVKYQITEYSSQEVFLNSSTRDMDSDGLFDGEEFNMIQCGGSRTDPLSNDTDEDGISDYSEYVHSVWGTEYWTSYSMKDSSQYWNNQYLNPVLSDIDSDGLIDGNETGIQFRTNVNEGNYNENSWIAINNDSLLYSSSRWMAQFSGYGNYHDSIKQSISENYTSMIPYGYVGVYTNFTSTSELGELLFQRTIYWDSIHTVKATHDVYQYNFTTIMIDANSTDGEAFEFNMSSNSTSNAELSPFPTTQWGKKEIVNFTFWTNPFCNDSDGDNLTDYDEINIYGSYPLESDHDEDGLDDYYEVFYNSTASTYIPYNGSNSTTDLNPHNPDTDGDGLWDGERIMDGNTTIHIGETSYVSNYPDTNPLNNDTDGDGLFDGYIEGGEKGRMSFRSTKIIPINESNGESIAYINTTNARDDFYGGYGYLGYMNITLEVAISYNHSQDLSVTLGCLWENGATSYDDNWTISNSLGPGNSTYFISYTLFDKLNYIENWDDVLSISSPQELWRSIALGHWYVIVEDGSTTNSSEPGSIERFELHVDFRTNASSNDSDGDGLSDWEEVTFGNFGWKTNPWDWYTDFDSLTDYEEVMGAGDALKPSDPTNNDTDADGTEDSDDLDPTGNAFFKFEFSRVEIMSGCTEGDDAGNTVDIYPVIAISNNGDFEDRTAFVIDADVENDILTLVELSAGNSTECPSGQEDNWAIIFDVPDNYLVGEMKKWFWLGAYDEDGSDNQDEFLLLNSSTNDGGIYGFSYDIDTGGEQPYITNLQSGTDARFWFNVTLDVISKKNTIIVLPSNNMMSQNATNRTPTTTDDELRFTVPGISFAIMMVYVNGAGNSNFTTGVNTILVPTPVLFGSQFWNITNSTSQENVSINLPEYMVNATWTMYNNSDVSSQITYLIFFECNASEASELLSYFLHNITGNKTCWYEEITEDIYTVGLPYHVTNFLPADIVTFTRWAGPGEDPEDDDKPWWDPGNTVEAACAVGNNINGIIKDITGIDLIYIFNTAVDLYVSFYSAALEWGLGAVRSPMDAINEIKDAVMDAINFIIEWLIAFITSAIESIITTLKSVVCNYIEDFDLELQDFLHEISWFDNETFTVATNSEKTAHMKTTSYQGIEFYLSFIGLQKYADDFTKIIDFILTNIEPYQSIFSITSFFITISSIIGFDINDSILSIADFIFSSSSSFFTELLSGMIIDGPIPKHYDYNFSTDASMSTEYPMISNSAIINYIDSIAGGDSPYLGIILDLIKYILTESGFISLFNETSEGTFNAGVSIFLAILFLTILFTGTNTKALSYGVKIISAITFFIELVAEENDREDLVSPLVISGLFEGLLTLMIDGSAQPIDEKGLAISLIEFQLHPFVLVL